jgi:hypothetical protein
MVSPQNLIMGTRVETYSTKPLKALLRSQQKQCSHGEAVFGLADSHPTRFQTRLRNEGETHKGRNRHDEMQYESRLFGWIVAIWAQGNKHMSLHC